jgi:MFS family permease
MNEMTNAPVPERTPNSVLQTWRKALTQPNEQTFVEISSSPEAKATTAYLWVFVASLIQIFLTALVQSQLLGTYADQFGLGDTFGPRSGLVSTLVGAICGAPLGAVVVTLFFAISVFIVQWIAKMFGGTGTADRLAYAMAAIIAPYTIISGIASLFSIVPYVGWCVTTIFALAGLYVLALEIMAVKGVNQISWGAAIGSVLIPGLVIGFLCACLIGVSVAALMPIIQETTPNFSP